jgi:hypothetical protein
MVVLVQQPLHYVLSLTHTGIVPEEFGFLVKTQCGKHSSGGCLCLCAWLTMRGEWVEQCAELVG